MAFTAFTAKFNKLLKEFGLNTASLSRRSGISQSYLSSLRAGKNQPTYDKLEILAKTFGVNVGYFFGEERQPRVDDLTAAIAFRSAKLEPETRKQVTRAILSILDAFDEKEAKEPAPPDVFGSSAAG